MKQFEAIGKALGQFEKETLTEFGEQFVTELKQIRDEHSEMVGLIKELTELKSSSFLLDELQNRAQYFLTKINDK